MGRPPCADEEQMRLPGEAYSRRWGRRRLGAAIGGGEPTAIRLHHLHTAGLARWLASKEPHSGAIDKGLRGVEER